VNTIVDISNVSKFYVRGNQHVSVLADINLRVNEGDFVALMGPSGSGKSTLLNLVAGLDQPTEGSITVNGVDITTLSEAALARWRGSHVGFIFQFYNLVPVLTAQENVELPLFLTPMSRRQRREHVDLVMTLVGLADRVHHLPGQLSGGQQQRVAIARALVVDPTIIVADEPTGDLDRSSATDVMDLLSRLSSELGKTIIMVTHDQRAAERAHHIRHLDKGVLEVH
jgi:putative ABC transport system ATP-binding protein